MTLSDGSLLPQQLGRDYALHDPVQSAGVFHPKIVVQLGRDGGRAFVGSANATASGIGGNLEIVMEVACTAEPSSTRDFVRSAWAFIEEVTVRAEGAASDSIAWARERTPWLAGAEARGVLTLDDGSLLALLARPGGDGLADRYADLIGADPVERLVVMSPFWDEGLAALRDLSERLGGPTVVVLVDPEAHGMPHPLPVMPKMELANCSSWGRGRFKHAKLILAQTAEYDHVLAGSANCTSPALGARGYAGSNSEASVYRRVPRDAALDALGLREFVEQSPMSIEDLQPVRRADPIPLQANYDRRPGRFEVEHGELRWHQPTRPWEGSLLLLDENGEELERIELEDLSGRGNTRSTRRDDLDDVRFVRIEHGVEHSTIAPLTHRGVMRSRRREAGTRSVAAAAAKFVGREDLQLFLLQALDELQRADAEVQSTPNLRAATGPTQPAEPTEQKSEILSYGRFVEQKMQARRASGGESSLSGTHADGVRDLLNRLSGAQTSGSASEDVVGQDWMDLGDEDPDTTLSRDVAEMEAAEQQPADRNAFVKAVRQYEQAMAGGEGARLVGSADVLRLRFWLMLLVHAARWRRYHGGLPCTAEDFGWPRLVIRVLSTFFYGRDAPIARLIVENAYLDLPVDFLETWATALWLVDLLPQAVGRCHGREEFLKRVPVLRQCMLQRMGLTREELQGTVMSRVWEGLDLDLGARLRDEGATSAPAVSDLTARRSGKNGKARAGAR